MHTTPEACAATDPVLTFGALTSDQFFFVRRQRGQFVAKGDTRVLVGHRLPSVNGAAPEGAFIEWSWDEHELLITNDRFGIYPAYYAVGPDWFGVATSVQRLVDEGVDSSLDEAALAVFFRTGTFVGDDTPFRAIRVIPPGTVFRWSGEPAAPVGRYLLKPQTATIGRAEARHLYGRLFAAAVRRRCHDAGDTAVALSGGMDSRHILFELCRLGKPPSLCVTAKVYRGVPSEDLNIAVQVVGALRVSHEALDQPDDWLEIEQRKTRSAHFCAFEHSWGVVIRDFLQGRVKTVFDGLGGDVLSDGRGILTPERHRAFQEGKFTELAQEFLGPEKHGPQYLSPSLQRRLSRELAVERLTAELARFADAPNPCSLFVFNNRTRRTVGLLPYGVWSDSVHVLTPYLDGALVDFLASLPAEMLMDHTFHAETIHQEFPDYAHIPFFSGRPCQLPPPDSAFYRHMARDVFRYALKSYPSSFLSNSYVMTRLARAMVDRGYQSSILWLAGPVVYGFELERFVRQRR